MKILVVIAIFVSGTCLGAGGGGFSIQVDTCNNGVLCTTAGGGACIAPGTPDYDSRYASACNGQNWDGTGTLTAPQLPSICTVPGTGGTISCTANCTTTLSGISKVNAKSTSSTPALPYVQFSRDASNNLVCQLYYQSGCGAKTVRNSMCKKAGAMIPSTSSSSGGQQSAI